MEDGDDSNIDSEKELPPKQKLKLAISKKNSTNQNTVQKVAISKTIRREIDLFEDEGFRRKYLEKVYRALLTVPPASVDAERAFSTTEGFYAIIFIAARHQVELQHINFCTVPPIAKFPYMVDKNNLALSPTFPYVSIESPL
ncbi:hypothetical protein TNCV_1845801 [Trichonephila clavipes]|nr:hypothetical protein TNCV_1845801 [Trichonephila clavipes]